MRSLRTRTRSRTALIALAAATLAFLPACKGTSQARPPVARPPVVHPPVGHPPVGRPGLPTDIAKELLTTVPDLMYVCPPSGRASVTGDDVLVVLERRYPLDPQHEKYVNPAVAEELATRINVERVRGTDTCTSRRPGRRARSRERRAVIRRLPGSRTTRWNARRGRSASEPSTTASPTT